MNKNMMRQAQKLQAELQKVQAELENSTVEGSSGGGVIKVTPGVDCLNFAISFDTLKPGS